MSENVVKIESLIQDDKNFNKGTEKGEQLINKSFAELGAGRSVLLDKDNRIIAGNKSQKAAINAGLKNVRIIETDGTELIAVKRTDVSLDSEKGRKLALADNLTQQVNLAWDEAVVFEIKNDLPEFNPEDYGFDFSKLKIEQNQELLTGIQEDDFEESPVEDREIQHGDIWLLGEHRLMCGDATIADDVDKLLYNDEKCNLLLTDPPYNVAYTGKTQDGLKISNDSMDNISFGNFLSAAFINAERKLIKGSSFYIFYASSESVNFINSASKSGLQIKEQLIWVKNSIVLSRQDYHWRHEPILYGWKEGAHHRWFSDRCQSTVLEFDRPSKNKEHPTMKPIALLAYLISNSSQRDDIVLDLFGGSGSTLIACEQLGRKARLMEIDPHYCNVIISRWEKLTGKSANKM